MRASPFAHALHIHRLSLSLFVRPFTSGNGSRAGTYVYMAPEMIRHESYDQKADVYSWGVLLAEVLTQRPPYDGLFLTPIQARPVRTIDVQ